MFALWVACILSLPSFAEASDFEQQVEAQYRALSDDFERNPYFRNAALTEYRTDYLARIPEFHMPPFEVFRLARLGHANVLRMKPGRVKKPDILTLVNFDEPIQSRRIYVFDLKNNRVLFNTFVAHGYKSDLNFDGVAERFSNEFNSNQSSLGFFIIGSNPGPSPSFRYTAQVDGIDGELNNHARARSILVHEWKALDVNQLGTGKPRALTYGQTQGCFGLPDHESGKNYGLADRPLNDLIIDTIAGQSLLFAYSSVVDLKSESLYLKDSD